MPLVKAERGSLLLHQRQQCARDLIPSFCIYFFRTLANFDGPCYVRNATILSVKRYASHLEL